MTQATTKAAGKPVDQAVSKAVGGSVIERVRQARSAIIDPATSRSLTGRLARIEADLGHIATSGLRPAALAVAVLFAAFALYTPFGFPPATHVPVEIYDVAIILASLGLYAVCRRKNLSYRSVHIVSAVLSFAVLGNVLMAAAMGANPLFSFSVAILLIASAGTVLSAMWAAFIAIIEVSAWAALAVVILPREQLGLNA
ncbi:MAG: hypothetical protein ACRDMZ_04655, partial [Solirubrobacteraceae bacterium]